MDLKFTTRRRRILEMALFAGPLLVAACCAGESLAQLGRAETKVSRCYKVDYKSLGKPMVTPTSAVQNCIICGVVGEPGTRQVVDAIQSQLKANALTAKQPAPVGILNITLAEENTNGKRNRT